MRSALLDEGADAFGRVARHHVRNHDLRGVPVGVGKAHSEWIPSRCDPIGMVTEERRQLIRANDRRKIRDGLAELKEQLEDIQRDNDQRRLARGDQLRVALVGYTNAGKSSLMRALTGSEVLVADKLFATLDTRCARCSRRRCRACSSRTGRGSIAFRKGSPRLANLMGL